MRDWVKSGWVLLAAFVALSVTMGAGAATAARLITGKDIKNGSITAKDLSAGVRDQLTESGAPGPQGPQGPKGDPGPKGDKGDDGISLLTFADTAVTPAIDLSGPDTVVTSTAAQLPNATGAVGGPIELPAGPGKSVTTYNLRVKTQGGGSYTCAVQLSVNGGAFFDVDRETSTADVMRYSTPAGGFLADTARTLQFRVVCNDGAGTRSVTDADLTVTVAVQKS
jgi:hypothetical protein